MEDSELKIVAVVAIRNGAFYFSRLCCHARQHGYSLAVIDNDSEDNLQLLIQQNQDVVVTSDMLPYKGQFDLLEQLDAKQKLIQALDVDWIIHLDVDELLFSDIQGERLCESIQRMESLGFNAVNFDEFVFLPMQRFKQFTKNNYDSMNWYYFFEPKPYRLVRCFKKELKTDVSSGGHTVLGNMNLYQNNMVMRHYMFENRAHAKVKYKNRLYSKKDVENKFHGNRLLLQETRLYLPNKKDLMRAGKFDWLLDKTAPKDKHFWEW